jgi:hypothetical protein
MNFYQQHSGLCIILFLVWIIALVLFRKFIFLKLSPEWQKRVKTVVVVICIAIIVISFYFVFF